MTVILNIVQNDWRYASLGWKIKHLSRDKQIERILDNYNIKYLNDVTQHSTHVLWHQGFYSLTPEFLFCELLLGTENTTCRKVQLELSLQYGVKSIRDLLSLVCTLKYPEKYSSYSTNKLVSVIIMSTSHDVHKLFFQKKHGQEFQIKILQWQLYNKVCSCLKW